MVSRGEKQAKKRKNVNEQMMMKMGKKQRQRDEK